MDLELPVDLPAGAVSRVVAAARTAGDVARRSYNEQEKWDSIAFGAVLWRLVWNHVEEALEELGYAPRYESNSLRFDLNGFECAIYSGGHSTNWDVHLYDFARTSKRKEAVNSDQQRLFDLTLVQPPMPIDPSTLTKITFVYCGNPELGLAALYVGSPLDTGGKIVWAWVECLYRNMGIVPAATSSPEPDYRDFSEIAEEDIHVDFIRRDDIDLDTDGTTG